MRGTVLTWHVDKGVASINGQRYEFKLTQWQGDIAPASGTAVEIHLENGQLVTLQPVSDADLAKETLNRLGGIGFKFGSTVLRCVGWPVLVAYLVFVVAEKSFAYGYRSASLAEVLNGFNENGVMGMIVMAITLATIAAPAYWRHKFAPLALCAPLLVTLYGAGRLISYGGIFNLLTFGGYVTLIAASFLAYQGLMRFQQFGVAVTSEPSLHNPITGEPRMKLEISTDKRLLPVFLLCFLGGGLGLHRFYVGKTGSGILMIVTFGGMGIWWLIDLIKILSKSFEDANGNKVTQW